MKSRLSALVCIILVLMAIVPASGIKVTGIVLVADVSPGDEIKHQMTIDIGETNETVDVAAQLFGCGMALDGTRVQLPAEEDTSPYSARRFLRLSPENATVSPGSISEIVLEGIVPQDVGAGGRYALVNIGTVPKGEQLAVSSAVEIPVFLTINGTDLIETGEIKDVNVSNDDEGLLVDVAFENTGNHHYKANAVATLKDDKGNVVAEETVPSENSIIPTYTRLFNIQFDKEIDLAQGTYTIEASVAKEDGTVLDSKETELEI